MGPELELKHSGLTRNGYRLSAGRDVVAGIVVIIAILMFAGTGSTVISQAIRALSGHTGGTNNLLVSGFLLNIALILFGWRRYKDLSKEVAERAAAERRASSLADTDPLTGFLNRRSIFDRTQTMVKVGLEQNKNTAFLMLDLDNFKLVNDVHGHSAGDIVLKEIARRIAEILPENGLLARLGGDEFACAFPFNPNQTELVDRIAEDIIESIAHPIINNGSHLVVTTSIGVAASEPACSEVDILMRSADIAMYSAKKQGRNRFCWFDQSMEMELQARNALETSMREGIPSGEFIPYYEQQVDLVTGKLVGFEMLARWESPLHGMVSPEVFIPIAEESGLIGDLSFSILRQAFDDAKDWDPSLTISVNISPVQLLDPWFAQKLVKLLLETGFPATRLEIEITESSLFDNLGMAQSIVKSLRNQGIRIALDDFGTGYSSLAHLRALPFDRIKIDRSFVTSILTSAESAAIVNAIVSIGSSLNLPITAEGIEDKLIADRMRDIGCGKGQGWFYGRPLSKVRTEQLLIDRNLIPIKALDELPVDQLPVIQIQANAAG